MMKMRQCICVMVAFSLFLLNCIETGWASEKKPVLDDDGNVVTEGEIDHRKFGYGQRGYYFKHNRGF